MTLKRIGEHKEYILEETERFCRSYFMNKTKVIELATYIIVALAIWVVSPLLGKFIDSFYFHYPNVFADSILFTLFGACIVLLGTILAVWTIILFKTTGRGTPNPKLPPRVFVVSGPYRFSRNPMALGGLLILLGEATIYYSPSLLGIAILYGVVVYLNAKYVEEPELRKRFGEPYADYLKRVPRFFPNPWKWYK
jgi:protein-S-isoprenylcysteine O-methyltransferase Ste14